MDQSASDLTQLLILGQCLGQANRLAEAKLAVDEGLALRLAALPATHWAVAQAKSLVGEVLVRSGRKAEGLRLLKEGAIGIEAGSNGTGKRTCWISEGTSRQWSGSLRRRWSRC